MLIDRLLWQANVLGIYFNVIIITEKHRLDLAGANYHHNNNKLNILGTYYLYFRGKLCISLFGNPVG